MLNAANHQYLAYAIVLFALVMAQSAIAQSTVSPSTMAQSDLSNSNKARTIVRVPKWEAGIAVGGQALNDYRGSKESQVNAYPVPYLLYRGDFLKADRDGVRGEFFSNSRIEFNLSGDSALVGDSEDNELREGMPELESAFELGPSLNINLTGKTFRDGWQLRLPVRGVLTVGGTGVHGIGYTFNPRFTYTKQNAWRNWRARLNLGALFATERYHDYYYDVDSAYVTQERPLYQSAGGFSGSYFKASLSRRSGAYWYGVSFRYDNLADAKFVDSPLVETDHYYSISFALAWAGWYSKSQTKIPY